MGRKKQNPDIVQEYPTQIPPRDPEEWENRMINLTMQAVEQRITNGTASAAEYVHFLKLGSSRERLEQEDRRKDIELKSAKTGAIEASQKSEQMFEEAIKAMSRYSGHGSDML